MFRLQRQRNNPCRGNTHSLNQKAVNVVSNAGLGLWLADSVLGIQKVLSLLTISKGPTITGGYYAN